MASEWQPRYEPALPLNWQGRSDNDERTTRFHEVVHCLDLRKGLDIDRNTPHIGFLGLASDEGIIRNQGRRGAAQGPRALRNALAKFPTGDNAFPVFCDAGDIICQDGNLEKAQDALATVLEVLLKANVHPVLFGGGHEIAWAHYQGLSNSYPGETIGIINFDAHFDLRPPLEKGLGTSGSPFLQIANHCSKSGIPFHYNCIGIQKLGNTPALFETAKRYNTKFVTAEEIHASSAEAYIPFLDRALEQSPKIMISICLDVFATPFAPGVSAPQPLGLFPWHVVSLLDYVARSPKIVGLHIAELSPSHDHDQCTANLAAMLAATYIRSHITSKRFDTF